MATKAQITANQANARKSTGPKSNKGKSKSRLNAVRHGLTAEEVLISGESAEELEDFFCEMEAYFNPVGPLENRLVVQIVDASWRLMRAAKLEAGIFELQHFRIEKDRKQGNRAKIEAEIFEETNNEYYKEQLRKHGSDALPEEQMAKLRAYQRKQIRTLGLAFLQDSNGPNAFGKLARYEAHIERTLYRALHELQRLQTSRLGGAAPLPIAIDVTQDTEADR